MLSVSGSGQRKPESQGSPGRNNQTGNKARRKEPVNFHIE